MERDAAQCAGRDDDRGRGTIGGFSPNSVLDSRWFILAFLGISWLPDLFDVKRDESIDILFTDINLPDGPDAIDGLELARKAVELCLSLRVIYTTGHGQTQPYTVNSLLKQFWRLLRKTSVDNNFPIRIFGTHLEPWSSDLSPAAAFAVGVRARIDTGAPAGGHR
jgi:hypothetical protein